MAEPKILSFADIQAAQDIKCELVPIPEWGGSVKVQTLTKARQQALRKQAMVDGQVNPDRLELLMLVNSVVEPEMTVEQGEELMRKASGPVDRILKKVMTLNGMTEEAQKEAVRTFLSGDVSTK